MLWEQVSCGIYLNIIQLAHSWPPTLFDGDIWFNVGYGIWWPKRNKNVRYFHVDHNSGTVVNDLLCLKTVHYMSQCPICPSGTSFLTDKSNKFNIFQRKFLWDSSRLSIGPTNVKFVCESHTYIYKICLNFMYWFIFLNDETFWKLWNLNISTCSAEVRRPDRPHLLLQFCPDVGAEAGECLRWGAGQSAGDLQQAHCGGAAHFHIYTQRLFLVQHADSQVYHICM